MALTTFVLAGTQDLNCEMVTPAQMEMTSFPSRADAMPDSLRMILAMLGLELRQQKVSARRRRELEE